MGKRLNIYVPDYVVFDLETTGLSIKKAEIIEIAAVKVKGGKVVDEFSTLVNPEIHIPRQASLVNGITDEMVADAPMIEEALKAFLEFAGDAILVGHNIQNFDLNFINRDARHYFAREVENDYVDTVPMSVMYLPKLSSHTLQDLAAYYGIDTAGAHRALNDCRMNQQLFERLGKEMRDPSADAKGIKKCPKCGNAMKLRNGRFGIFWGCTGYPGCRYTENK